MIGSRTHNLLITRSNPYTTKPPWFLYFPLLPLKLLTATMLLILQSCEAATGKINTYMTTNVKG